MPQLSNHAPYDPAVAAKAALDDRAWFAAHPEKTLRVRPAIAGEFSPPSRPTNQKRFTILFDADDGTIGKVDVFAPTMPKQDEVALATIFDRVTDERKKKARAEARA